MQTTDVVGQFAIVRGLWTKANVRQFDCLTCVEQVEHHRDSYQSICQCIFCLAARLQNLLCKYWPRWIDRRSIRSPERLCRHITEPSNSRAPRRTRFAWIGQRSRVIGGLLGNGACLTVCRLVVGSIITARWWRCASWSRWNHTSHQRVRC